MSTRCAIAIQEGDGWKGRYVHDDGDPATKGNDLRTLVDRDGYDAVVKTIITGDHYGWSAIEPRQPSITGVIPDESARYGTPAKTAWYFSPEGFYGDGRYANVPGYGIAYTEAQGVSPDYWITHEDDGIHIEWAYVLNERGFTYFKKNFETRSWDLINFVPWGSDQEVP